MLAYDLYGIRGLPFGEVRSCLLISGPSGTGMGQAMDSGDITHEFVWK